MKIFEVVDPIHKILPGFIKLAAEYLGLEELPTIDVVKQVPNAEGTTFGRYEPEVRTIWLVAHGRHPKDVLRTLAHELVHYQQDVEERLQYDSGETGSNEENEANAVAGIIMRNYSEQNPE